MRWLIVLLLLFFYFKLVLCYLIIFVEENFDCKDQKVDIFCLFVNGKKKVCIVLKVRIVVYVRFILKDCEYGLMYGLLVDGIWVFFGCGGIFFVCYILGMLIF